MENILPAIISAVSSLLVGILAFVGVVVTNNKANNKMQNEMRTAQAVTEERIDELTREVREHNNFAQKIPVLQEQIKSLNHRVKDLEQYHKPN